jgi:hypothetical protein
VFQCQLILGAYRRPTQHYGFVRYVRLILYIVEGNDDERLLDAHVKSSHASTKVHGRYHRADARSPDAESKTVSVDVVIVVLMSWGWTHTRIWLGVETSFFQGFAETRTTTRNNNKKQQQQQQR